MDAKPQRLRALHTQNDENIVPVSKPTLLHQRHKSTGALNTMTMLGGTKVPSKRAVFGDISNTTRASNGIHDNAKAAGLENSKPIAQGKGATFAFEKPAQRMGLQNVIKNFVTGGSSSQASENNATNRPRALSKRATTQVYQDENSYPQAENASFPKTQNNSGPLPPVHQSLIPNKFKSQPQLRTNQPIGVPQQENYATNGYAAGSACNSQPALAKAELPAQPKEEQQVHIHQDHASSEPAFFDALPHLERPVEKNELQVVPLEQQYYQGAEMQHRALPLVSEPEEYWVEEEEVYDEQGYTQTNSLSHGGNTTANLTTSLIPMVNKRIRIELAECKKIVEAARTPEEIEEDKYDTSMVAEYSEEIFEYMREMEIKMSPNPNYMDNQAEIQWSMRSVLMDWLIQVHHRFALLPETLFLCVNYIDRFLSKKIVSLGKLQLVGATAIFVAAKYEEINCPSVNEIVYMVDDGYTADEILKAERFMLGMLEFELGWPGPMSFLRRISKADDYDLETRTLAKYFLEITIMDERFVGVQPSFLAAGAHCISRQLLRKGDWTVAHIHYSGYTYAQLHALLVTLYECCLEPSRHHSAVYEKYADKRYKKCSLFVQTQINEGFVVAPVPYQYLPSPTTDEDGFYVDQENRYPFDGQMMAVKG